MLSPKESSWCHLAAYAETNSPVTCFFHLIVATARPLLTISTLRFGDGKSMLLSPNGYGVLHAMMKHNCEHMNKGRLKRIPTDIYIYIYIHTHILNTTNTYIHMYGNYILRYIYRRVSSWHTDRQTDTQTAWQTACFPIIYCIPLIHWVVNWATAKQTHTTSTAAQMLDILDNSRVMITLLGIPMHIFIYRERCMLFIMHVFPTAPRSSQSPRHPRGGWWGAVAHDALPVHLGGSRGANNNMQSMSNQWAHM